MQRLCFFFELCLSYTFWFHTPCMFFELLFKPFSHSIGVCLFYFYLFFILLFWLFILFSLYFSWGGGSLTFPTLPLTSEDDWENFPTLPLTS